MSGPWSYSLFFEKKEFSAQLTPTKLSTVQRCFRFLVPVFDHVEGRSLSLHKGLGRDPGPNQGCERSRPESPTCHLSAAKASEECFESSQVIIGRIQQRNKSNILAKYSKKSNV
jgi:hypothetical protein